MVNTTPYPARRARYVFRNHHSSQTRKAAGLYLCEGRASHELPSEDLPRATFGAIGSGFCCLKAHAFIEQASWSSSEIVGAKGDNGQLGRRLDELKAVLHERLGNSLPPPASANREPADPVVWGVRCREEQPTYEGRAGSTILLADTKGPLPLDIALKRRMKAWLSHHRAKQGLNLCRKIKPDRNISGLCQGNVHRQTHLE